MGKNNLQRLRPDEAVALSGVFSATLGTTTPGPYGISSLQRSHLTGSTEDLASANVAVDNAKAAYHTAVQTRDAALLTNIGALASIARTAYANPAVTPPMITALGLSPRSTTKTKVAPQAPPSLNAAMLPTGSVALNWDRGGNSTGTTFVVESQSGTGAWTTAGITTKAKLVLSGYAAGTPTNFRVTAVKDDVPSAASPVVVVYPSANAAPALRLAA